MMDTVLRKVIEFGERSVLTGAGFELIVSEGKFDPSDSPRRSLLKP